MVKLLAEAMSTPAEDRTRVRVELDYAKLVKYEVNVRSFHPNKQFEPAGFRFHGDDRGFSLGESYFGKPPIGDYVTSRIWQRYLLDMALKATAELDNDPGVQLKQESNPSEPGPGMWSILGGKEEYKKKGYKPRGKLTATHVNVPHGGQKEVGMLSWYGGENHAFIASRTMHSATNGKTIVPTLDVFSDLFVTVERIELYLDIESMVYGDGFPNCESFIKDGAGNKLFLGTHARIGTPSSHLWFENKRLMWANAIRVEIDPDGNFGERLWVFAQVVGGPPALREEYPVKPDFEVCAPVPRPRFVDYPFSDKPDKFIWECGNLDSITQRGKGSDAGMQPIHLSAYTSIEEVRKKMKEAWIAGPVRKITRTEWNDYHLHRNPNDGRSSDDYDVSEDKWKKQS